jgi:alpha-glucosidase
MAVPQLCNLGLSGMSYAGTDVGGFGSDVTPELMARWVQLGCFSPFFRSHCAKFSANQEPWVMPPAVLDIFRKYVDYAINCCPIFTMPRVHARLQVCRDGAACSTSGKMIRMCES